MKNKQPIVYCWRYENQPFCKIGKSFLEIVWNSRLKYAQSVNVLDIEVLGICRCDSELERDKLEKHLLNERFDKAHPDRRELVYFNSKVRNWIQHNYVENNIEYKELGEQPGVTLGVFKNDASMVVENKTLILEKRELK